jgi:uncharacterized protein (DUF4415 family)
MTDEQIIAAIASDPDAAPILNDDWFRKAELVLPGAKRPISIRLATEVLDYFMEAGPGYQSRINAVLVSYVREQRNRKVLDAFFPQRDQTELSERWHLRLVAGGLDRAPTYVKAIDSEARTSDPAKRPDRRKRRAKAR